jgi:FMN reductase
VAPFLHKRFHQSIMSKLNAVAVTGNLTVPSRTVVLARAILAALESLRELNATLIDLSAIGTNLVCAVRREDVEPAVEEVLSATESADILIAVTPVYRGSFTGLFKHYFDLLDQDSLRDVPVILGATGGGRRHTLVVEYALRPLFAFFGAHTVPTAIYAADEDFDSGRVLLPELVSRIREAARQAVGLLGLSPVLTAQALPLPLRLVP